MSENSKQENGLFETLEVCTSEYTSVEINYLKFYEDEKKYEFLVQDMLLIHFFP
jgi:hypothetical protein